jgi:hypothetical protein
LTAFATIEQTDTRKHTMSETQPVTDNVVPLPSRLRDDPQAAVSDFVRDHPLLVVAGGIAVGMIVSSLLPKGTGRKLASRAVSLAEIAGAASMALGKDAWDKAETAGSAIGKRSGELAERAGELGKAGVERASTAGGAAADRIEKIATPATQAAADFAELVAEKAAEIANRFRAKR